MIDSCSAAIVAERLIALLRNPEAQESLVQGGIAFAERHQFGGLAEAMLSAVSG
jgi:hypothetical protein